MGEIVKAGAPGRTAIVDGLAGAVDTGSTLKLWSGSAPADPDGAATGTLACTHDLTSSTFAAASDDGTTATSTGTPPANANGVADTTPGYARILNAAGNTVAQGTVGADGDGTVLVELDPTDVMIGVPVVILSLALSYTNA